MQALKFNSIPILFLILSCLLNSCSYTEGVDIKGEWVCTNNVNLADNSLEDLLILKEDSIIVKHIVNGDSIAYEQGGIYSYEPDESIINCSVLDTNIVFEIKKLTNDTLEILAPGNIFKAYVRKLGEKP